MFDGIVTAVVTPFKNGEIDVPSLKKLIRYQLDSGVDGLVLAGTTGESPTLDKHEKKKLFEVAKFEVGTQVPLIFGTGSNNTRETVNATQEAEAWGADGALVVVPYYNKPPQSGLLAHYKEVARNTSLPILLYNVPGRTVVGLSADSIADLARVPNIVGVKEASADSGFAREVCDRTPSNFLVTGGDDGAYLDVFSAGGRGVISVLSHIIPKEMKKLSQRVIKGEAGSHKEFAKYAKLVEILFAEANPIPVKAAMKMMGHIESDEVRLPLISISDGLRRDLHNELRVLGVLK